jgi:hypothetical protein
MNSAPHVVIYRKSRKYVANLKGPGNTDPDNGMGGPVGNILTVKPNFS